ncbi:hypothetical protein ACP70R_004325 [Stipagrostis hirtigluma subsp. patula]
MAAVPASDAADLPALRDDERGIPRALPLLAALVEADCRRYASAASQPAGSDLVRAFRGGAASIAAVPIGEFLERVHRFIQLESVRHVIRLEATSYVLAGVYLTRFMRSPAAREAGILVEPATAHRLVAVSLFLGAKFGGPDETLPKRWTVVFEISSDGAIRAGEMAGLEERFLRAVDYRLFVDGEVFSWFCGILEQGAQPERGSCGGQKRSASAAAGEEAERRSVRPRLLPPAVTSS